jgi:hypothetical protein
MVNRSYSMSFNSFDAINNIYAWLFCSSIPQYTTMMDRRNFSFYLSVAKQLIHNFQTVEILKSFMFLVLTLSGSEKTQIFKNIHVYPPFSGSKRKPNNKPTEEVKLRLILLLLASCLAYSLTLKMEAIYSSEALRCFQTTWHYNVHSRSLHMWGLT